MLKILGYEYKFQESNLLSSAGMSGNFNCETMAINIDAETNTINKVTTTLHEIIEALNYHLALGLSEEQIMALEAGLYQVLVDNRINLQPLLENLDNESKG